MSKKTAHFERTEIADQIEQCRLASIETTDDFLDEVGKRLKAAHPRLILRSQTADGIAYEFRPYISEVDPRLSAADNRADTLTPSKEATT